MSQSEIILQKIVKQQGITILAQSRLKSLILDMMPSAERKHINVLKRAIDEQIGAKLLEMQHDDPALRQIKINTLKEKFKNDNAFDDTANYIVDCFVNVLGWNTPEPEIVLPFKEIKIGNQICADRNLDVSHFRHGDPIPIMESIEEWFEAGKNQHPACCYYNNDPENSKKYGKLYNWYAVADPRGLAPEGWRISSADDWTELISCFDEDAINFGTLKTEYRHWKPSELFGFSIITGGQRSAHAQYTWADYAGSWWSSTERSVTNAVSCSFLSDFGFFSCNDHYSKSYGFSVRCLRDID